MTATRTWLQRGSQGPKGQDTSTPSLTSPQAASTALRAWRLTGSRDVGIKSGPSSTLWKKWEAGSSSFGTSLTLQATTLTQSCGCMSWLPALKREAERTSRRYKLVAQHRARRGLHHPSGRRAYGHTKDYRQIVDEEAARLLQAAKAVDQGRAVWAICRGVDAARCPHA